MPQTIRIKVQAYDSRLLDQSVKDIMTSVKRTGAKVIGPIPLPVKIERFTVNRSPLGNKKSMDQFEIRTYKRILDIKETTGNSIDELKKLSLSSGISIQLKILT